MTQYEMGHDEFLYWMAQRTLAHVLGVLSLSIIFAVIGYNSSYTIGLGFCASMTAVVWIKELAFDPHPDWRYWVKTVVDMVVWLFGFITFYPVVYNAFMG